MEFPFDVGKVLPGIITVLESDYNESDIRIYPLDAKLDERQDTNTSWIYHSSANTPWDIKLKKRKEDLNTIINEMGLASAKAQSLRSPITTLKKLLNSKNQKIYFIRDANNNKVVIGFLKMGMKRLFVSDDVGAHHEVDPLCVLDFYIHETRQRCGFGHELFNIMLETEKVLPEKLAIDRPSFKFLSFLSKHYDLKNPISQSNNFVIFPGFFLNREVTRPPIFLYSGKAMQSTKSNYSAKQHSRPGSCSSEAEALNSFKVPLCSGELKKNKTYYSSAAKCLMWNDDEKATTHKKKLIAPNYSARSTNSSNIKSSCNWHIHTGNENSDAQEIGGWSTSHSTPCSLTPVNNVPNYSPRKWDQLQSSSWNILGVKPVDYALYQKQN